jgi:hypothetical protein
MIKKQEIVIIIIIIIIIINLLKIKKREDSTQIKISNTQNCDTEKFRQKRKKQKLRGDL